MFTISAVALAASSSVSALARTSDSPSGNIPFNFTLRVLGTDTYQLEVDNTNPTRFIKSFVWTPPSGATVTKVTSVEGGTCDLAGGVIECKGTIYPPSCSAPVEE